MPPVPRNSPSISNRLPTPRPASPPPPPVASDVVFAPVPPNTTSPEPASQLQAGQLRVFNQGARIFTHHELQIRPGVFTTIPPEHEKGVLHLLDKYPTELIAEESAHAAAKINARTVQDLRAQISDLNEKLAAQTRNSPTPEVLAENTTLKSRLAMAEDRSTELDRDHRASVDRIRELGSILNQRTEDLNNLRTQHGALNDTMVAANNTIQSLRAASPSTDLDQDTANRLRERDETIARLEKELADAKQ